MTDWDQALLNTIVAVLVAITALAIAVYLKLTRSKKKPKYRPPISGWTWAWTIPLASFAGIMIAHVGYTKGPLIAVLVVTGLILAFFAVCFVYGGIQGYRRYDRDAALALKRGQAGDTEGAIAELRAVMEGRGNPEPQPDEMMASRNPYSAPLAGRKPSAARPFAMGILHFMREEWLEAHQWFVEAEKSGGHRANCLMNQGVTMIKMGRLSEAETLLKEVCRLTPGDVLAFSNYGHVLADLGRLDEAKERLAWAERNFKFHFATPAAARKAMTDELESLRKKLAADSKPSQVKQ